MATAGARYQELTGNIWSYSHRGDLTGLRAALSRGVCPNIVNTVGWSPCHAAAAGGHTKVLRLLAKNGADFTITDNGGNTAAHQAAKNGHVHVLRVLSDELGVDITNVRLSHAKGKATREYIIEAYRKAGKKSIDEDDEQAPVGYARRQAKSNAFFGPGRTPISTKIKKRIIKEKRLKNKEKADTKCIEEEEIQPQYYRTTSTSDTDECNEKEEQLSYIETVRQVKRNKKLRRKQKQGRTQQNHIPEAEEQQDNITSEDDEEEDNLSIDVGEEMSVTANGFAALLLLGDSDSE